MASEKPSILSMMDGDGKSSGAAQLKDYIENDPYFNSKAKKKGTLPSWLDHFNERDLKELFKCSVAAWVTTILIFINPTLRVIGQAAFFGWYYQRRGMLRVLFADIKAA